MDGVNRELELENRLLREENQWLREHYEHLRRQELVSHLVTGRFLDVDSILLDLQRHDIQLNRDDYVLLYVRVLTDPSVLFGEAAGEDLMYYERNIIPLESFIEETLRQTYECHAVHMDSGALCLVGLERTHRTPPRGPDATQGPPHGQPAAAGPESNPIDQINRAATELYQLILEKFGTTVFIAISRPSLGVEGIPDVYRDVKQIVDYRQITGLDVPVLCYHDFEQEQRTHPEEHSALALEQEFLGQLATGQYASARKTILEILSMAASQTVVSLHTIRIQTSAKLHMLLLTLDQSPQFQDSRAREQLLSSLREIDEEPIAMERMEQLVDQVFGQIAREAAGRSAWHQPKWYSSLMDYIQENYRDPGMNVSSISDRFLLTPSHLSREVKRQRGESLFDYVQQLRLHHAQSALARGETVQEAAEHSGFGDTRSMRRAFQKYLGITPSQYIDTLQRDTEQPRPEGSSTHLTQRSGA